MTNDTVTQIKALANVASETAEMIGRVSTGNTDRLHMLGQMRTDLERIERLTVIEARNCGWTWQDVGDALGITRQAAQQRFGS